MNITQIEQFDAEHNVIKKFRSREFLKDLVLDRFQILTKRTKKVLSISEEM